MKMVAEYLDKALDFESLAHAESDEQLKATLLGQAEAYRKLAAERAAKVSEPGQQDHVWKSSVRLKSDGSKTPLATAYVCGSMIDAANAIRSHPEIAAAGSLRLAVTGGPGRADVAKEAPGKVFLYEVSTEEMPDEAT